MSRIAKSKSERTRVAVVGVGYIGQHHARILADMPDVELVAVVDQNEEAAKSFAEKYKTTAVADFRELVGQVDAVTVAVPTVHHTRVAREFLKRGVATLVEKPIAATPDEARDLVHLADKNDAVLQVGHSERFNPAWLAVENSLIKPNFVEARRLSPYPFRSLDVSVVLDVMIHDIDLVLSAVDAPVERVEAVGSQVLSPSTDWAEARVVFMNGCQASISASRVHHEPVRKMSFFGERETLEVDFFRRSTTRVGLSGAEDVVIPKLPTPDERKVLWEKLFAVQSDAHDRAVEPLRLELAEFVRCARESETPKVSGEAGYAALALAFRIDEIIRSTGRWTELRKSA